ncbi:MAG: nucleotidyl transferase AbiEii/AbiGii toxin family protein [Zavarzinella sp.]
MAKKKNTAKSSSFDDIKRAIIIGLFSIDQLLDKLVLKGGNALSLVYDISTRASLDIDLSIPGEFDDSKEVSSLIESSLQASFDDLSFQLFDFSMTEEPREVTNDLTGFWGGYSVMFKLIEKSKYFEHPHELDWLRRNSITLGNSNVRKFTVDISKHEYCKEKRDHQINGYKIYVYTPAMIVCEKLRAICQQIDEYRKIVFKHKAKRARDFLDIFQICELEEIDPKQDSFRSTLLNVFTIKNVPLRLLNNLENERDFHKSDFISVKATVANSSELKDFDFYFQFTLDFIQKLETFWNE